MEVEDKDKVEDKVEDEVEAEHRVHVAGRRIGARAMTSLDERIPQPMGAHDRRLKAHDMAQTLFVGVVEITEDLPRGFASLKDQARRAAHSAVRNLSEGEFRVSPADKRSRYSIARGEVGECDACLDSIGRLGLAKAAEVDRLRGLAGELAAILYALIQRWS